MKFFRIPFLHDYCEIFYPSPRPVLSLIDAAKCQKELL